jgi:hypothetical protein
VSFTINELARVYLKYDYENSGDNGCARTIKEFKKNNNSKEISLKIKRNSYGEYRCENVKPGSRKHKKISRLKSSYNNHWEISCNGVIIDLTPIGNNDFKLLRHKNNSGWQKLAGVRIRAVKDFHFLDDYRHLIYLKKECNNLVIMDNDPIPLLWKNKEF